MEAQALTHFDRVVIILAVAGSVIFALLPVIFVLIVRDKPGSDRR